MHVHHTVSKHILLQLVAPEVIITPPTSFFMFEPPPHAPGNFRLALYCISYFISHKKFGLDCG